MMERQNRAVSDRIIIRLMELNFHVKFPAEFKVAAIMVRNCSVGGYFTRPYSWLIDKACCSSATIKSAIKILETIEVLKVKPHKKYGRFNKQNTYRFNFKNLINITHIDIALDYTKAQKQAVLAIRNAQRTRKAGRSDICTLNDQIAKAKKIYSDATAKLEKILYKNKNKEKIKNKKSQKPKKVEKRSTFGNLTDRSWASGLVPI